MTDELGRATESAWTRPLQDRLDSWKEIASYLKRDVTTVRRWEKREGLPVHRHLHDRRESVYAYTHEVDRWWADRRTELVDKTPSSPTAAPRRSTAKWVSAAAAFALAAMAVGISLYRWRGVPEDADAPRVVRMSIQPEGAIIDLAFSPDGR